MAPDLVGKQLQLLKEVVPKISRVAVLWNADNPGGVPQLRQAEAAARALGVRLQSLEARGPHELDSAFAAMTREQAGALVILNDAVLGVNLSKQIAELAAKSRLPAMHGVPEYAQAGGLMVYGANLLDLERRAATFVDKILKGAARRLADRAAEQVRAHHQPQNRQGARADDPVQSAVAGRSGA
jgi:putative ABC transport system substrate-binding protein